MKGPLNSQRLKVASRYEDPSEWGSETLHFSIRWLPKTVIRNSWTRLKTPSGGCSVPAARDRPNFPFIHQVDVTMATHMDHVKKKTGSPIPSSMAPGNTLVIGEQCAVHRPWTWAVTEESSHTVVLRATVMDKRPMQGLVGSRQQDLGQYDVAMSRTAAKVPLLSQLPFGPKPSLLQFPVLELKGHKSSLSSVLGWIVSLESHMLEFQPPQYLRMELYLETIFKVVMKLKMRSLDWALIQSDLCPSKQRRLRHRYEQKENLVRTQIEDGLLQVKKRSLRRN